MISHIYLFLPNLTSDNLLFFHSKLILIPKEMEYCFKTTMSNKIGAREKADEIRKRSTKFILPGSLLFILSIFLFSIFRGVAALLTIVGLGLVAFGYIIRKEAETWSLGAWGEERVARKLKELEPEYRIFNDLVLPGEASNIDHVVLSRKGIYVIETKNLTGEIRCNGDSWERIKTGRRGTRYPGGIGSPSKQVKRNAVKLKTFLKKECPKIFRDKNIFIEGIVVFSETARLEIENSTVEVVAIDDLREAIERKDTADIFTEKEVSKMSNALANCKD